MLVSHVGVSRDKDPSLHEMIGLAQILNESLLEKLEERSSVLGFAEKADIWRIIERGISCHQFWPAVQPNLLTRGPHRQNRVGESMRRSGCSVWIALVDDVVSTIDVKRFASDQLRSIHA
jgi:hypothetical protein